MNLNDPIPLFIYLLMEEDVEKNYMRMERRLFRDRQNPFDVPDEHFNNLYRLNKQLAMNLINEFEIHVLLPLRTTAVPFHLEVLATLNFLGNGSYQKPVGNSNSICLSQSVISRAINEICKLISLHLMQEWIQFLTNAITKNVVKHGFYAKWGFRGVIGAIDGTHVEIIAPPVTDENHPPFVYINRKGKHSINVMLISDSDCRILAVNARYPGSVHDSAIFHMSNVRDFLKNEYENGDKSSHLISDTGYALEPWLFTPFLNYEEESGEALFNNMLKSARNVIERTNGVLEGRFRCLSRHRVLNYHPATAAYIIYACCVLHNIAIKARIPWDQEMNETVVDEEDDGNVSHARQDQNLNQNLLTLRREAVIRINFKNLLLGRLHKSLCSRRKFFL